MMTERKANDEMINDLFRLITSIENEDDCKNLFYDLCTNNEIEQMALRISAARLLLEGKTFNEVTNKFDISSATLSRVSRCVKYGNGYSKLLK